MNEYFPLPVKPKPDTVYSSASETSIVAQNLKHTSVSHTVATGDILFYLVPVLHAPLCFSVNTHNSADVYASAAENSPPTNAPLCVLFAEDFPDVCVL